VRRRSCATAPCENALKARLAGEGETPPALVGALQLSIAGIRAAVRLQTVDPELRLASLRIAAMLAGTGAAALRRYARDEQLLDCAVACERATIMCEDACRRAA
jgi:hypothetical protein